MQEFSKYAKQEYFKLYASTAKAVKAVSSRFRVGGPATAGCAWVPETIDFCVKNNVPIDFISTHHYCVDSGYLDETGTSGTVFSQDSNAMSGALHNVRRQIAESADPNLELHFTEWSCFVYPERSDSRQLSQCCIYFKQPEAFRQCAAVYVILDFH